MQRSEFAPAKINLTLEVLGRRPDAYHELRSLVAFAQDVGDVLALKTGGVAGVEITGPFADAIVGSNLVDKAVSAFTAKTTLPNPVRISLQKNLPVASGIGGGSADAAAALRLLASAHPEVSDDDLCRMAQELGADVSACLKSRGMMMTGTGEKLVEVALPNDLYAVLVNPLVAVPPDKTSQVFSKLRAPALVDIHREEKPPRFSSVRDVVGYAEARRNDLEPPAGSLLPAIDVVLSELRQLDGNCLSRLSGAGPTCFGVFESESAAHAAASTLQRRQPGWWIRTTRLV
jgi:4-diphosphocytidyl-2-C-methyl-D-erythritol kinase